MGIWLSLSLLSISTDVVQWLSSLPQETEEIPHIPFIMPEAAQTRGDLVVEEDDEKFVPTRLFYPSAPWLSILSGPLSLPPLAVGAFIIVLPI